MNEKIEEHNVVSPDFDVWTPLEKLAKEARSDFFDYVSDETLNVISDCCGILEENFKEYLIREQKFKEQLRIICPDTFKEKWKLFLKVCIQGIESSYVKDIRFDPIMQLLPYVSDMRFLQDTLEIKIDVFDPKLIYLFGNVGADEYSEEDGWYQAWWD